LSEGRPQSRYRWDALLNPEPVQAYAAASAASKKTATKRKNSNRG